VKAGRIFLLALAVFAVMTSTASAKSGRVLAVRFNADVNPVTQKWLNDRIAEGAKYDALVILIDTPGGLEDSMRKIVQAELNAKEKIVVYVSPRGARAASAGVWISEAADVLAMAPDTNIGSSTPISSTGANIGSDLRRKVVNDAAASLRALMKSHHRNAAWGDQAVRVASNLTDTEALRMHVIDRIAPDLPSLLKQIGLGGDTIVTEKMGFFTRLLNTLIDPNLISLLFLAGIAGLAFEIFHPGAVIPGAFGGICMVVALFGFSVLPTSWAGVALILLGIVLLVIDAHVTTHGALTLSGLVALGLGMVTLFHSAPAPYHVQLWFVLAVTGVIGGFMAFALTKAVQARRRPSAMPAFVGVEGVVRDDGLVSVRGELWSAATEDGAPLRPGEHVAVDGVDGLQLKVHRV